ncbi:MAG: S-methyl-5-thioribose-1-phosphate isomerase [Phycisphaerae bacterium]|nr:S-methyl-5-thioribose-1-phosphate isomerase [Phycisphaerae bacterium]MDD5380469.1 S-methyl-5-thioribose-1-phosphate isomerase [Phycisphaerae bacterium]
MIAATVKWIGSVNGFLELIDQRKLPGKLVKLKCRDIKQLYEAIKTLTVRGAPAIGVAGAYGLVLAVRKLSGRCSIAEAFERLKKAADYLRLSRPTAVNLSWALDRVILTVEKFAAENPKTTLQSLRKILLKEAKAIHQEDAEMCRSIGKNGQKFIKNGSGILTHCNAGALATAGQGTALSVMFEAHKKGKKFKVYVDETRPILQGARLTAWELKQAKIDAVVICDNMAGWLMKQGKISAVITGADRIAANGDAANKIGTYSLSILAKEHGIPFYIAAPSSTFDLSIKSGNQIPIEQRSADEVRFLGKKRITPDGVDIYNPAFDVTPAENITAIISEKGTIRQPTKKKIRQMLGQKPWQRKTRKI